MLSHRRHFEHRKSTLILAWKRLVECSFHRVLWEAGMGGSFNLGSLKAIKSTPVAKVLEGSFSPRGITLCLLGDDSGFKLPLSCSCERKLEIKLPASPNKAHCVCLLTSQREFFDAEIKLLKPLIVRLTSQNFFGEMYTGT